MDITVADLYREIGKKLRSMGAERVYLYSSKTLTDGMREMELKIITDGEVDAEEAMRQMETQYPCVKIEVVNGNEPEYMELLEETMTDSIQI